jgi:hypothetical protein
MYPPAPWRMTGDLWLSLFRVTGVPGRPDGIHGVAFVHYVEPSPLTYRELLVARVHGGQGLPAVNITDIWVDSPDSMVGGRELWAIPKDLADFELREEPTRRTSRTTWAATFEGRPIATAAFSDVSHRAPRTPLRGRTWQQRDDGSPVSAAVTGSARSLPARSHWTFAPDGPLGFLTGRRSLGSFRMADFEMSFG